MPTITIDRRYRGPRESGNGGYAAGLLAQEFCGGVEVTLRKPPPLDRRLAVVRDAGRAFLLDGEELVAEARPMEPALEPPEPPTEAEVVAAAAAATRWETPDFADCFVCGTRGDGSGLEIHPGPVPGRDGIVAATWIAREVSPEVVWAAIDCPGAYAVADPGTTEPLLGRMTARVDRLPREGEHCVVVAWPLGAEGRKLHAGTALYADDATALAVARQVWILPRGLTTLVLNQHKRSSSPQFVRGVSATSRPPSSS